MTQKPTEIKVKARMAETFYSLNRHLCLAPAETEQYGGEIADTANYLKPVKGQENNQPVRTLSRSRQVKVNWQDDGGGIHILPKTRLYQFGVISAVPHALGMGSFLGASSFAHCVALVVTSKVLGSRKMKQKSNNVKGFST